MGMSVSLIHSFLRHLSEENAFTSLHMAEPYLNNPHYRLVGVGLDSSEVGHPPEKFARVFAHAGELDCPRGACRGRGCRNMCVRRWIGDYYGNTSLEDDALTERLVAEEKTLTVCPLSNDKLCVIDDLRDHPIPSMLRLGLKATINSDDPAYFGGYIGDNFMALADRGLTDREDCLALHAIPSRGHSFAWNKTAPKEIDAYDRNTCRFPCRRRMTLRRWRKFLCANRS